MESNAQQLAAYAENNLCLEKAKLSAAYYYQSLPFCIIDAVFSLGVRYGQVENVVQHVAKVTDWTVFRNHGADFSDESDQASVADLLETFGRHPDPCQTLFNNRGYANPSARNVPKVQKADLVREFAETLSRNGVETFQTFAACKSPDDLDEKLKGLPALKSGVGVRYFRMLAGDDDQVKPDRMIQRFIKDGVGEQLSVDDSAALVQEACQVLKGKFPTLTPRLLDHEIWKFQRSQKSR